MADGITVAVWDQANTSKVADLDNTWGRSWQDLANDPGTAGFELDSDNANADELTVGRHVRFSLGGDLAFTSVIADGDLDRTLAGDGDDAAKVTKVRSRGLLAEWDDATVQPVNGMDGRPYADRRPFNWACKEMPISSWSTAYAYLPRIATQFNLDPPYMHPWYPPRGWPTLSCEWLWPINRGNVYPVTTGLLVRDLTISTAGTYTMFFTGDQRSRLFVDGLEAHGWTSQWPTQSFVECFQTEVYLSVGTHRIAIETETFDLSSLGLPARGMATWCCHKPDGTGDYNSSTLIAGCDHSDWKGWDTEHEGNVFPAPNPYHILSTVLSEAQADDMLTGWSLSCTSTVDSNGQAWATPVEVVPRVGDSGLDLLRMLGEVSIDFRARPAGKVLDVFNKGNRGSVVGGVSIEADDNAYRLERVA